MIKKIIDALDSAKVVFWVFVALFSISLAALMDPGAWRTR